MKKKANQKEKGKKKIIMIEPGSHVVFSNFGRSHYYYISKTFDILGFQLFEIWFLVLVVTRGCMDGVISCDWKLSCFFPPRHVICILTESCLVICTSSRDLAFTRHETLSRNWLIVWLCSSYCLHLPMDRASSSHEGKNTLSSRLAGTLRRWFRNYDFFIDDWCFVKLVL